MRPRMNLFARSALLALGGAVVCASAPAAEEGFIFVKSDPPGARIWIDGVESQWSAPRLLRDIAPGTHVILVKDAEHGSAQAEVTVTAGKIRTLNLKLSKEEVAATGPAGTLEVTSTPPGATVWVDTAERGRTPVTVSDLRPGSHSVVAMLDGFQLAEKEVRIGPGTRESLNLVLVREGAPSADAASRGQSSATGESASGGGAAGSPAKEEIPAYIEVDCPYCKGSGVINEMGCPQCICTGYHGIGRCPKCNGSGRLEYKCPMCGGNGTDVHGKECRGCRGKGAPPCIACKGTGKIRRPNPEAAGYPTRPCIMCDGTGFDSQQRCLRCGGKGTVRGPSAGGWYVRSQCKVCGGDGLGPPTCRACQGRGYRGPVTNPYPCPQCCGTGHAYVPCKTCGGLGYIRSK